MKERQRISGYFSRISFACISLMLSIPLIITVIIPGIGFDMLLGLFPILFSVLSSFFFEKRLSGKKRDTFWVAFFCLLNLASNIFIVSLLSSDVVQISDFSLAYNVAISDTTVDLQDYFRIAPHKFFYPHLLFAFGLRSQFPILLFQAVMDSIAGGLAFLCGTVVKNQTVGFCAALFYSLCFSRMSYVLVLSEEHMAINIVLVILLLFQWILSSWQNERGEKPTAILVYLLTGITMGIGSLFKDWGTILFIAAVLVFVLNCINFTKKTIIIALLGFAIAFFASSIIKNESLDIVANKVGVERVNNNTLPFYIYVNFHPDTDGGYHEERYLYVEEKYRNEAWNYDLVNKELMHQWKNETQNKYYNLFFLLLDKWNGAYINVSSIEDWSYYSIEEEYRPRYSLVHSVSSSLNNGMWIFIIILAISTCIINVIKNNIIVQYITISVLGCYYAVAVMERQGRYKYSILSLWYLLAACCVYSIICVKDKANSYRNEL